MVATIVFALTVEEDLLATRTEHDERKRLLDYYSTFYGGVISHHADSRFAISLAARAVVFIPFALATRNLRRQQHEVAQWY